MVKTSNLNIKVEKNIYDEAVNTLSRYNMNISQAVIIFITSIAKKQKISNPWEDDYVTTPQEDEYDLKCYNNAVKEWEKSGFKTFSFDELYEEFGVK
jgi:antitoxin component of RelBE/YafQ-DinJ toxin-antitoxin module